MLAIAIVFVVIVIIPVAIGAPPVAVFIPPLMIAGVAVLASFVQVVTRSLCLRAIVALWLDGFVKAMIRFRKPPLAVVGTRTSRAGKEHEPRQCCTCQRYLGRPKDSGLTWCLHSVL